MRLTTRLLTFTLAAALAACGGGSSSSGGGTGALGARITTGAISALTASSITVNGASIDTSGTPVTIDDTSHPESDLQVGMVVRVKVDDKGHATEVHSSADVQGNVAVVSPSTITVGGQVVRLDDSTHFDDSTRSAAGLQPGDHVRVNGFPDDRGGLRATRVDRSASASSEFEIHGVVSALDATAGTFTLTVSSAPGAAAFSVSLAAGVTLPAGLANGSFVEVKAASQPTADGKVTASAVKLDDDASLGAAGGEAEVEGIVTSGSSASFVVDGHTVTTGATTKWLGGAPSDLVAGAKVEAEGTLDASGTLAASKVSFRDSLRFQGAVTAVTPTDAHNGSFTMLGGALTVHVSDATELDGLDLTTLAVAQSVEVRGYPSSAGGNDVVATRIALGSGGGGGGGSTRIFIQGPVSNVNATAKTFKILGFTIDASAASTLSRDDSPLSADATALLTSLTDGTVVKARADSAAALTGTTLVAKELELEDDR